MTEQQFDKLRELLDSSNAPDNSTELDQLILSAAHQHAADTKKEQQKQHKKELAHRRLMSWLTTVLQAGLVQAAVLSVTLTLSLFFVFGQITKVDEVILTKDNSLNYHESLKERTPVNSYAYKKPDNLLADSFTTIPKPTLEINEAPHMASSREQVLAQMQTPDIQALLDDMQFEHQTDRQLAESAITIAMSEIKFMLHAGDIETARQRYALLKDMCSVCELPDTLEALAANYNVQPRRG